MVGDRIYDIEGARACGIETVAVSYGYGSNEEFNRAAPAYRANSVPELAALLKALLLHR
jgi:phosphoglycolate phosphatase